MMPIRGHTRAQERQAGIDTERALNGRILTPRRIRKAQRALANDPIAQPRPGPDEPPPF